MKKQILFIQGGGEGAYEADRKLAASLQDTLGAEYDVRYPKMSSESDPDYELWKVKIRKELAALEGKVILIGHSTLERFTTFITKGEKIMRKIIVLSFITLDGVMQGPGGPTEDTGGNFTYGGWTVPYFDDFLGQTMAEQMGRPFDLLLGRKTFEIFASYWPHHEDEGAGINNATKYVASNTLTKHEWRKSVFLKGDVVAEIKRLKQQDGPELQVHGSGNLIQTLLAHDLVDEFWLKIFPVTLGMGKRLFDKGTIPASYTLLESKSSPSGVIIATFKRAGDVETGSF